jgi:hypothetical protein
MKGTVGDQVRYPIEFLDINLLHAIHSPFYRQILKKPILYSGFRNLHRKIHETRKLVSVQEYHFLEQKNVCRIPSKIGKIGVYVQKRRLKMLNKNSIPGMSRK